MQCLIEHLKGFSQKHPTQRFNESELAHLQFGSMHRFNYLGISIDEFLQFQKDVSQKHPELVDYLPTMGDFLAEYFHSKSLTDKDYFTIGRILFFGASYRLDEEGNPLVLGDLRKAARISKQNITRLIPSYAPIFPVVPERAIALLRHTFAERAVRCLDCYCDPADKTKCQYSPVAAG